MTRQRPLHRGLLALPAAALLLSATFAVPLPAFAAGGTVSGDKTLGATDIGCGGSTTVTVTLQSQTGIAGDPADIMLVLDRSGSMVGQPFADMKSGASQFVDIIDEASDGSLDGVISNGSRVGVVSFSNGADLNQPLTSNATAVKTAINALAIQNLTNHQAGIDLAQGQLAGSQPSSQKQMVIFTDGATTAGGNPGAAAAAARAAGTEIFAIGLGSANVTQLNNWATDPDSSHVFLATDSDALQAIFEAIGAAIVVPAATNVQVVDTVDSHFTVSAESASKGTVVRIGNELTWSIPELGTETVTMTYTVTHDATTPGGVEQPSLSTTYADDEGHAISFANASLNVRGCAKTLDLTPTSDTNTVGDDHTVTATVLDDFGDPVSGVSVDFGVTGGPSVVDGDPSAPSPATGAGVTDVAGATTFTYSNSEAAADTITATAATQQNVAAVLSDTANKTWLPITASIDIKPGGFPNSYGASSRGNIPVALLGAAGFDISMVDVSTVRFGDAPTPDGEAAESHGMDHPQHVNGDGFLDSVYHFPFLDTNLDPSDTQACLGGEIGGLDFLGCDSVNIVP